MGSGCICGKKKLTRPGEICSIESPGALGLTSYLWGGRGGGYQITTVSKAKKSTNSSVSIFIKIGYPPLNNLLSKSLQVFIKSCLIFLFYALFKPYLKAGVQSGSVTKFIISKFIITKFIRNRVYTEQNLYVTFFISHKIYT